MLLPVGATPPPYSKICDIFGNYERTLTKISVISLLARRIVFGEKIEICQPPLGSTPPYIVKYGSHKKQRIET